MVAVSEKENLSEKELKARAKKYDPSKRSSITVGKCEYELGKILGRGKFAEVRRGRNVKTKQIVALKVLYIDVDVDKFRLLREQVRDEIRAFQKVKHPNVIRLLGFDSRAYLSPRGSGPRPCMIQVQECCTKGELYEYVQYAGMFEPKLARTLFHQFISGLEAIHNQGIAHRDLKPDNTLLDGNYSLKICDFGFSTKFQTEGQKKAELTTILGTLGYMSPEMLAGEKYDEKTDIFSAGVILFILLSGYPPMQEARRGDWWFERLAEGRYLRFWEAHEQGPKRFTEEEKTLLLGMLLPNPKQRFSIPQIKQSEWYNGEVYPKKVYHTKMKEIKRLVDQKRKAGTVRDMEFQPLQTFCSEYPKDQPIHLSSLANNPLREQFSNVKNNEDLSTLLNKIGDKYKTISRIRNAKPLVEVEQCGHKLANCESSKDIMDVLSLDGSGAPILLKALNEQLLPEGGKVKWQNFVPLAEASCPRFDPELDEISLSTYRARCGYDIVTYALRVFTKTKRKGKMQVYEAEMFVETTFAVEKEFKIPNLDTGALEDQFLSVDLIVQTQVYKETDGTFLIVFRKGDDNYTTMSDFMDIVTKITQDTLLSAFIVGPVESSEF